MKNQNSHPTNFWFGFALGSITAAAAGYLLGTKHGRETLKKLLEYAENIEDHNAPIIIEQIKNTMKNLSSEGGNNPSEPHHPPQNIENVMEKIKTVAQPKSIQKFFSKSGEIINK